MPDNPVLPAESVAAKPYYDEGGLTIYHGRMEDIIPTLKAAAVLTDPPYGISDRPFVTNGKYGRRGDNNWHPPSDWDATIDPAWPALCCGAAPVVAWFGHWRKRPEVEAAMTYPIRAEIVWAKDMHVGPPAPLAPRDERIWLFSEAGIKGRTFQTSVWDVPVIPTWNRKWHKNEKPVSIMRRLVEFLTDPGDLVIDPFMGSGTTLRAAKDCGRRAIGIEVEEAYCEGAAQRLSQEVLDFGQAS